MESINAPCGCLVTKKLSLWVIALYKGVSSSLFVISIITDDVTYYYINFWILVVITPILKTQKINTKSELASVQHTY